MFATSPRARVIRAASPIAHRFLPTAALSALLATTLLAAHPAQAADAPKATSSAKAKPKSLLLTRDELRSCMKTKAQIEDQASQLAQQQTQLNGEKAELVRAGEDLNQRLAALDRSNQEQVQQYVDANNAREKRIDAFEANGKAFDEKVHALEALRADYQKACAHKRFDADDEAAIKAGK